MTETTELMAVKTRIAHRAVRRTDHRSVEEWNQSPKRDHPKTSASCCTNCGRHSRGWRHGEFSSSASRRVCARSGCCRCPPPICARLVRYCARAGKKYVARGKDCSGQTIVGRNEGSADAHDRNAVDPELKRLPNVKSAKPRLATIRLAAVQRVLQSSLKYPTMGAVSAPIHQNDSTKAPDPPGRPRAHERARDSIAHFHAGISTHCDHRHFRPRRWDGCGGAASKTEGSILFESVPGSAAAGFSFLLLATSRVLWLALSEFYARRWSSAIRRLHNGC